MSISNSFIQITDEMIDEAARAYLEYQATHRSRIRFSIRTALNILQKQQREQLICKHCDEVIELAERQPSVGDPVYIHLRFGGQMCSTQKAEPKTDAT